MTTAVPSDVLTFLFTDIEGSTRRWETDADAMRVALETHNRLLRDTVEAHGGQVFNYTGDGMSAVFTSPRAAVDAAVAAQRALELPVRMGIATGEAELRGGDYFGTVLNRTARVMAAGHGGQILIDGATAILLSDVDLLDLGPRQLRDITKPVAMYQVRAPGLRSEFRPLRTLDSTPGNLRPPATTIVGRESDVVEVQTVLKAHRLVTLTGVGGVGKTRLAVEVAARSAHDFADGVFLIELAAVADPAAVPEAVAAVLGIAQQPGLSLANSIAAALEGRSRLLVFDNCEHVLDAAADIIEAIFTASMTIRILATSREGLRVPDEQIWPVGSLDLEHGINSSAASLFVERAAGFAHGPSLTDSDDATAVVEICRRLDGIPLAIELAASRMVSMSPTELRDRLDDRFRLLVGSRRGLERHQTLHHTVQWSYDLLGADEQKLLNSCSVFAGGFDLAAASVVAGSKDDIGTLDLLDALVRKSLVVATRSSSRTRFSMLETIRQFAEEQLVRTGEADAVRTAHARYFAGREADVLALWDSPRQREAYAWFTLELANLRAAFRWAADHSDLDIAASIAVYATQLGYWVQQYEPGAWAEELIDSAKAANHPRLAQVYMTAATCYMTGRIDDFLRYFDAGQNAIDSRRFDDVPPELEALLGGGFLTTVDPERCVDWARNLIARSQARFDYVGANLVFALAYAGAYDEALSVSEELLIAADKIENPTAVCSALLAWGVAHRTVDPPGAHKALRRGLAIAQANGDRQMESVHAMNLASMATSYADPMDALEFSAMAIRTYFDSGSLSFVSGPLGILAALFDRIGYYEPAAVISAFADTAVSHATYPEIVTAIAHLREVLGAEAYETFARAGAEMSNAAKAAYALDQIDLARANLVQTNESP
jgi:predicted ATPase/class 3 adenylate cyclase